MDVLFWTCMQKLVNLCGNLTEHYHLRLVSCLNERAIWCILTNVELHILAHFHPLGPMRLQYHLPAHLLRAVQPLATVIAL